MYLKGRPITMYLPKDQLDSYCLEAKAELPGRKLKLDWVYPSILTCGTCVLESVCVCASECVWGRVCLGDLHRIRKFMFFARQ